MEISARAGAGVVLEHRRCTHFWQVRPTRSNVTATASRDASPLFEMSEMATSFGRAFVDPSSQHSWNSRSDVGAVFPSIFSTIRIDDLIMVSSTAAVTKG